MTLPGGAQTMGQLSLPSHPAEARRPEGPPAVKTAPRQPVAQAGRFIVAESRPEPVRREPARPEPVRHEPAKSPRRTETRPADRPAATVEAAPAAAALPIPPLPPKLAAQAPAAPGGKPPAKEAGKANQKAAEKPLEVDRREKPETGPKVPRFAALRADEVNMRAGPGTRYRIEWVYKRRDLPVEILRDFEVWRYVRDADGVQGWMQQATLMARRTFIVRKADATLRGSPRDNGSPVAVLKVGVIGRIRSCEAASDWCEVQAGGYRGYLRREQFWGTLPHEAINP